MIKRVLMASAALALSAALAQAQEVKIGLVNQLSRTGLCKIEVASFVSPKLVPNMRDANEVLAGIDRLPGVHYVALVPNIRGAQNAWHGASDSNDSSDSISGLLTWGSMTGQQTRR